MDSFEQTAQVSEPGANGHTDVRSSMPVVELAAILDAADGFEAWRIGLRRAVLTNVAEFVAAQCAAESAAAGVDVAADILMDFVSGGKCLRSTFMCLGWLCGAVPTDAALRAAASFELLHAFALLQDDVMDASASRRGRPAAHIQFARWHRERKLSGSAGLFGESAAILLADLCLIWSEQMLRESGVDLLGVFGSPAVTGKPSGGDLIERKATTVVVAAHQMADAPTRRQLTELINGEHLDDSALDRWRMLIIATGAAQLVEDMITDRAKSARNELGEIRIDESVRAALANMAAVCMERAA